MCSNGSFEEFQTTTSINYLTNFEYTTTDVQNPIQCQSVNQTANQSIKQYNPADFGLMATTVPANFPDEYIGNINGFDQYCTKLNCKDSGTTMTILQAKRFKTDNENNLVFNYKAVLQSIDGDAHKNEQPYFKARIINNSGTVVSEFCLIADTQNCIFTVSQTLEAGSIVLYTKKEIFYQNQHLQLVSPIAAIQEALPLQQLVLSNIVLMAAPFGKLLQLWPVWCQVAI